MVKQRAEFIERIKINLLNRKTDMDRQLASQSHEKLTDGVVQDSADEVLSLSMENLQNSLQRTEIDELHLIEDALVRIGKSEYGLDNPITMTFVSYLCSP